MDEESFIQLAIFIALLFLSAFFSGSETAIFSLNLLEKENLKRKAGSKLKSFLNLIITKPDHVLITILTGNMIVNVFAAMLFDTMFAQAQRDIVSTLISISLMTGILLVIGEMTPKNIAVRRSLSFTRLIYMPLYVIHGLITPLRFVLNKIRELFLIRVKQAGPDKRIINTTIKIGLKEGIINQFEYSLFESYLDLNTMNAADIMIPRTEIMGVDITTDIKKLIRDLRKQKIRANGSQILIYSKNIDHPVGYIEIKDLLPFLLTKNARSKLKQVLKPLHSIPESKKLNLLMKEMKDLDCGMALVVDEYGGTAGLITFQTLIENILSYFYIAERESVEEIEKGKYTVPGTLELKTLNDVLSLQIDSPSRTVSGLLIENLGEIPKEGSTLTLEHVRFTVVKTLKNRIKKILIEVKS
ncbi:MAG: HlyC/CorC family transporter [Spirochaetales bacterium]|nr:HlyC/CorC family transporter [Spirochaetales bacterium]